MSQCIVLNENGQLTTIIEEYEELEWSRSHLAAGSFSLSMSRTAFTPALIKKGYFLSPSENGLPSTQLFRIEQIELEIEDDRDYVAIEGRSVSAILADRVCLPTPGFMHDTQKGPLETVIKHYVQHNIGTKAAPARQLKNLVIAPDQGRGPMVSYQARYQSILEIIEELGAVHAFGWELEYDPASGQLTFDLVFGEDRTAGNPNAVYFDLDFNSVMSQHWLSTELEQKNYAYVAGQGEGAEREIITRFRTPEMEGSNDLFIIESRKEDFEMGTLTRTYAHDAGHLELQVENAAASDIDDSQEDFEEGELDDVVATNAGGLELKTSTYVQPYNVYEEFEDDIFNDGITFDGNYSLFTNESEAYSKKSCMRAVQYNPSPGVNGARFLLGYPACPSDSYSRTLSFYIRKTQSNNSFYLNLYYYPDASATGGTYDTRYRLTFGTTDNISQHAALLYGPDGKLVTNTSIGTSEMDWHRVVVNLDKAAAGDTSAGKIGVEYTYSSYSGSGRTTHYFVDDAQFHYERTITGYPTDGIGTRVSPPFALSSPSGSATSRIEWDADVPQGTELKIEAAVTDSSSKKPEDWQYKTVPQSGSEIPGVQGQDVTGKYLWVRQTLKSPDPTVTPVIHRLAAYLGQTYFPDGNRLAPAIDLTTVGTATNHVIEWQADLPQGTGVEVYTSIDGGVTWEKAVNGQPVPGIAPGMDLRGRLLRIRQNLYTDDVTKTPQLTDFNILFNVGVFKEPEGFARREAFFDARDITGSVALSQRGDAKIAETMTEDIFETVVNPHGPFQYKRDWDVGDLVTVRNADWGMEKGVRIVGVKHNITGDSEELTVELGKPFPTLKDNVKREVDRGNNQRT